MREVFEKSVPSSPLARKWNKKYLIPTGDEVLSHLFLHLAICNKIYAAEHKQFSDKAGMIDAQ